MTASSVARRHFLGSAAQITSLAAAAMLMPSGLRHAVAQTEAGTADDAALQAARAAPEVGKPLPLWSKGELDINHINTGRGDAQFMILPDGTTLMEDASGKTVEKPPFSLPTKPDTSRPPGEWVARYIQRVLPKGTRKIDYAVLSHFHGDHMGSIVKDSPLASNGAYQLSGITVIPEFIPIARIIDRGWPNYDYPAPLTNLTVRNYRKFLDWQAKNRGLQVAQFQPGHADQIVLLHDPKSYPAFEIRNLAANGVVWTGVGDNTHALFPSIKDLPTDDYPIENKLSIAFRISYGRFDYYSGGDLSSNDEETAFHPPPWKDIETAVSQVCGPVDVMKADHHGSWDANSIPLLANLRPRVIVVDARAEGHPAVNTLERMMSKRVWPGERDVFITNVSPATFKTTYGIEKAKSTQGHIVIRVAPGGDSYRVFVLEDDDERMLVKAVFGPYASR